jgi:hypothetical protein
VAEGSEVRKGEFGGGEGEESGFEREGVRGVCSGRVEGVVEGTGAVADLDFVGEVRNGEVEYADELRVWERRPGWWLLTCLRWCRKLC